MFTIQRLIRHHIFDPTDIACLTFLDFPYLIQTILIDFLYLDLPRLFLFADLIKI